MNIRDLFIAAAIIIVSIIVAALAIHHTMSQAFKGLKLALKSEIKSTVGRVNVLAMVLFLLIILVFNLEEMLANALRVGGAPQRGTDLVTVGILIGIFFMGSLICVMLVEKNDR
jgi:hypothetical protein